MRQALVWIFLGATGCGMDPPPGPPATCTSHRDCPTSLVCDLDQVAQTGKGQCFPPSSVLYVNNRDGACMLGGDGSQTTPYCRLQDGIDAATAGRPVIHLSASTKDYGIATISGMGKKVLLYGPGPGSTTKAVLSGNGVVDAITVAGGAEVLFDGVEISYSARGVLCQGAGSKLTLRRDQILKSAARALETQDCNLVVDRSLLSQNLGGGIVLERTQYKITNTFLVDNRNIVGSTVEFGTGCSGKFAFNTLAKNTSPFGVPGAIQCGSPRRIENSLVSGNTVSMVGSQLAGCTLDKVVVSAMDNAPGGIKKNISFLDPNHVDAGLRNYRLDRSAANLDCCVDQGLADTSVLFDHDGTQRPRPEGSGYDIGAHEVN